MVTTTINIFYCILFLILGIFKAGLSLKCYDCKVQFKERYIPTQCQYNVQELYGEPRDCLHNEYYCMVTRKETNGVVTYFERNCAKPEKCKHGCKYSGFGLTKMQCTSCCSQDGCNTDNGTSSLTPMITILGGCLLLVFYLEYFT
ncbi:uncharacterized protein LOC144452070 [Glandiceps talaboti]